MINLFDNYNNESKKLHESQKRSGYGYTTVVINYDGFLPDDVISPYSYFLGKENSTELAKYFNQVEVPNYWEIIADGNGGGIYDLKERRANIIYAEPKHLRRLSFVEWLDDKENVVRLVERYNKYGRKFAETTFNLKQEPIFTTYYDVDNKEIIVENHVTNDIILNTEKGIKIFKNQIEFIKYFFKVANIDTSSIIYNTLSNSFLTTLELENSGQDILVWQEQITDFIPGNMNFILENDIRTKKIIVPSKETYNKILAIVDDKYKHMFVNKGYAYGFTRDYVFNKETLILTNSDEIENIEDIVSKLPNIKFNIGALTEMSAKLMSLEKYSNVNLYPNITTRETEQLFNKCSVYLDINHWAEILDAVEKAFMNNMLILSFDNTVHRLEYTADNNIYLQSDVIGFVEKLHRVTTDEKYLRESIVDQLEKANTETKISYGEYIND